MRAMLNPTQTRKTNIFKEKFIQIKMPIDYKKYPKNWRDEIRPRILARAKFKCESCLAEQGAKYVTIFGDRYFLLQEKDILYYKKSGYKIKTVWLSIAHIDNVVDNVSDDNLIAECQVCHLRRDQSFHQIMRLAKKR